MTARAVGLAAAGAVLALLAAGCRESAEPGGRADRARDAGAAGEPEPRRPETAVIAKIAVRRLDSAQPRPIREEELAARLRRVLSASSAFAADAGAVPAGRTGIAADLEITVRYDVAVPPGPKAAGKSVVVVGVEAVLDWKAGGERLEPRENVIIERPIDRGEERRLDPLVNEVVGQAVELAARGLADKETLRQGDDAAVLAALRSDDPDATLWALDLCADRRLAASFDRAVALLEASDPGVRAAALRVLVALRDPRAVEPLARRADFADPETMRALIEAVTAIGGPEAIEFLELVAGGHAEADMRERAREGLERLGRRQRPSP